MVERRWTLDVSEPRIDVAALDEETLLRLLQAALRAEERPAVPWGISIDVRTSAPRDGP